MEKLREGARPLTETRPDIPKGLSDTLSRALDHDPRKRPDAAELRDGLLAVLHLEPEPDEPMVADDAPPEPAATASPRHVPTN